MWHFLSLHSHSEIYIQLAMRNVSKHTDENNNYKEVKTKKATQHNYVSLWKEFHK